MGALEETLAVYVTITPSESFETMYISDLKNNYRWSSGTQLPHLKYGLLPLALNVILVGAAYHDTERRIPSYPLTNQLSQFVYHFQ